MSTDTALSVDEVDYPTSDGKPMAETDLHRRLMVELIDTLDGYYANRPDVYVSGDLMVYYEPGNKRRFLAPDCFVAFGVPKRTRDLYKVWEEEGRFPSVVFEVTSQSTRDEDLDHKLEIYRDIWRVDEYFLFDPRGEYLSPSLLGYRWLDGKFVPMEMMVGQSLFSDRLGMYLEPHGPDLLLIEATTGRRLCTPVRQQMLEAMRHQREAEVAREQAEAAAVADRAAREQAEAAAAADRVAREQVEAENARLRAELAALRNPPQPS